MRWTSVAATGASSERVLEEVLAGLHAGLAGESPQLLVVFVTPHHGLSYAEVGRRLHEAWPHASMIGCSAGGVVGGGREIEQEAALSVVAAVLPDAVVHTFHLPGGLVQVTGPLADDQVIAAVGVPADASASFIVLCEPFTCHAEELAHSLDRLYAGCAKVGGLASGAKARGQGALFLDGRVVHDGAVGVALVGDVVMDTVVAQGCRPVGAPLRVTGAELNVALQLDGRPALQVLHELFEGLEPRQRALFQRAPMVGIAMEPQALSWRRGDFLIRQLLGVDPRRQGVAVGHGLEAGDVLQFHVRDAAASAEDMHELLGRYARERGGSAPQGAMLFSCLGRGATFYGQPDHDIGVITEHLGPIAVGGFFCNGEIGPVHGRTFLHGYTSSMALFRTQDWN